MSIIVYDLEIAEEVGESKEEWAKAKRGEKGVSSLVLYDSLTERYHLYDEYTFDVAVDHLNSADLLVSFNGKEFDRPCFEGFTGCHIIPREFDILQAVWSALGRPRKGWRLGQVCERTLGLEKVHSGSSAPRLYQDGRFGELFDYNLNDVFLTRKLYNHIVDYGTLIGPDGEELQLLEYPDEPA